MCFSCMIIFFAMNTRASRGYVGAGPRYTVRSNDACESRRKSIQRLFNDLPATCDGIVVGGFLYDALLLRGRGGVGRGSGAAWLRLRVHEINFHL